MSLEILNNFPEASEFYIKYWNKKPFLVKDGIDQDIISKLIPADELAGLSLDEDIRSRIVTKGKNNKDWTCEHGPFDEGKFSELNENDWSLLVQNVDQYHEGTENLLSSFGFSPKWMIDDIMVSYSAIGGGVGPHLDSYHVFLVQGMGKRNWKIGREAIIHEKYVAGLDLKILEDDFKGDEIEVTAGDVLYIPPYFAHAGETIEEALTYSVGFLGPSMSELMVEFGQYIEEQEKVNSRYSGDKLDESSAGEDMAKKEVDNIRNSLIDIIQSDLFEEWLKDYFTELD